MFSTVSSRLNQANVQINISLLAHIAADSELQGRYGVQGYVFVNTIEYFKTYLNTLPEAYTNLKELTTSVCDLHRYALILHQMHEGGCSMEEATAFSNAIAKAIYSLPTKGEIILPGGWRNSESPGHAMIYHFKKTEDALRFYIYNAGAGVDYHEKTSSISSERYFSTKVYEFKTYELHQLEYLIRRLVVARIAHLHREFNSKDLYVHNIDEIIPFINDLTQTEPLLAQNLTKDVLTTTGQISGTCTQRSIHQMLKHYFSSLEEYRRFIIDFKIYAIKDYLNTHTRCSQPIQELVSYAIINTINICDTPELYTLEDKKTKLETLYQLQHQLTQRTLEIKSIKIPALSNDFSFIKKKSNTVPDSMFALSECSHQRQPERKIQGIKTLPVESYVVMLNQIYSACELAANAGDAIWVLKQIEQVFLDLPIPKSFKDDDVFYRYLITPSIFESFVQILYDFQLLFNRCRETAFGKNQYVAQATIQMSIMAINDYCHRKYAETYKKPDYSPFFAYIIEAYFKSYRYSPYLASHHVILDERFQALTLLYSESEKDNNIFPYYNALIQTCPDLYDALKDKYYSSERPSDNAFHDAIVTKKAEAIYVLCNQFVQNAPEITLQENSFLTSPLYQELITEIRKQWEYECSILRGINPLVTSEYSKNFLLSITFNETFNRITFNDTFNLSSQTIYYSSYRSEITQHQYEVKRPEIKAACHHESPAGFWSDQSKKTSNIIQISPFDTPTTRVINKDDFFIRDLFHLRTSKRHQASLTVDYFDNDDVRDHLKDPEIQRYVEGNIFEPGVLAITLNKDATFLGRFDKFIRSGLKAFVAINKEMTHEALFFIRLSAYVNRFVVEHRPEEMPRLTDDYDRICNLILFNRDNHILASLHQYRFILGMARYQQTQDLPLNYFEALLISYFSIQANANLYVPLDEETRAELTFSKREFQECIKAHINDIDEAMIQRVLAHFKSHFQEQLATLSISRSGTDSYVFSLEDKYVIDVENGALYLGNKKISPIPLYMNHSLLFKQFGLDHESSCLMYPGDSTFEFSTPTGTLRFLRDSDGSLRVQKEFLLNESAYWYELYPFNPQQKKQLNLTSSCFFYDDNKKELNDALTDGSMQAWSLCSKVQGKSIPPQFILTQNNTPLFYTKTSWSPFNSSENHQLYSSENHQPLCKAPAQSYFDDPKFMICTADHLFFKRYGLHLDCTPNQQYVLRDRPSFIYNPDAKFPIPGVANLGFKEAYQKGVQTIERDYFIVPVQRFLPSWNTPIDDGEFFHFKHDISGEIAKAQLAEIWEKRNLRTENYPLWHYENTCQAIVFPIINGEPKPEKAADALYLSYLYLAAGQPEHAWNSLQTIQQRFSLEGSYEELTFLEWIINALPVVLDKKDNESIRKTPAYQACQLNAISLLTTFIMTGKRIQWPITSTINETTANGEYELFCIKKIKSFYKSIPSLISKKLNHYLNVERHLVNPFYLNESIMKSLLAYYTRQANDINGALGYRQRESTLATLIREKRLLENNIKLLQDTPSKGTFIPLDLDATQKRLNEINEEVGLQKKVMKRSTVLEKVTVDLTLPKQNINIDASSLTDKAREFYYKWHYKLGEIDSQSASLAMGALSPDISEETFFMFFPDYYNISKNSKHTDRQKLIDFCRNYLIAHRHTPLRERCDNMLLLINLLYRRAYSKDLYFKHVLGIASELRSSENECLVPKIEIYQAQDVFKEPLAEVQSIFESLSKKIPAIEKSIPLPELSLEDVDNSHRLTQHVPTSLLSELLVDELQNDKFTEFCEQYQTNESEFETQLNIELSKLDENPTFEQLEKAEEEAGQIQYHHFDKKKKLANIFSDEQLQLSLQNKIGEMQSIWQKKTSDALEFLLELSAELPDSPEERQRIQISRSTLKQSKPTEKDLLNLYYKAIPSAYRELMGLSEQKIQELHQHIHAYAQQKLHLQHIVRIQKALEQTKTTPTEEQFLVLASTLMSKNEVSGQKDPAILRFQLEENMLLRPRQIEALRSLLSPTESPHQFDERIEKVIMGGGKSKVLLPLMAQKKATGLNLVVVEVPHPLLKTNHADLNATSQKLFNQAAHIFEFDRDSECSSARLEEIYQQLLNIMTSKDYLITTGESVQSFRLKYLELLYSKPHEGSEEIVIEEWSNQIRAATKIVRLFKERGDVIIDEVHDGLLLKRKLNYAFGEPIPIPPEVIRLNIALFVFLQSKLKFLPAMERQDTQEQIKNNEKTLKSHWNSIKEEFPYMLVYSAESPLRSYVNTLCEDNDEKKEALIRYLKEEETCDFLLDCGNKAILDAFAFFKAQQKILDVTLNKQYQENYGPSKIEALSEIKRSLAIPYAGNDNPKERSQFSSQLETMNYTIQSLRLKGISRTMLNETVQQWLIQARQELLEMKGGSLTETHIAQAVTSLYLNRINLRFEDLDVQNEALMSQLYNALHQDDTLIYDILENEILPQINQEQHILSSNPLNHADIYRSRQGISGTPSNYRTFHQCLKFNPKTSLGTDGFIQKLILNQRAPLSVVPFTNLKDFLKKVLESNSSINAIMDICATFTGYPAHDVARTLAELYPERFNYVLFFDSSNRLCAVSSKKPNALPIVLGTSDPDEIMQRLGGCPLDKRFTYYDQSHTFGADIKQAPHACGLALIDERTELQAFLQGVWRMRGLETGQSISVVSQHSLPNLEEYLEHMKKNEAIRIKNDIFISALDKIDNLYYNNLMIHIYSCQAPMEQATLAEKFKTFFLQTQQLDLFKKYGTVSKKMSTEKVLKEYSDDAFRRWEHFVQKAGIKINTPEKQALLESSNRIIEKTLPHCPAEIEWHPNNQEGQEHQNQKENQKENQQQKEEQKDEEFFNPELTEENSIPWTQDNYDKFCTGTNSINQQNLEPLNHHLPGLDISESLLISPNYRDVYIDQTRMLSYFLKPVHAILFRLHEDKLTACIITNEELRDITECQENNPKDNAWIVNLKSTVLSGHPPKYLLQPKKPLNPTELRMYEQYHQLMEQACFFAGEMSILSAQEVPLTWITQYPDQKLAFFEKHLMAYRKTSPQDLVNIKILFSIAKKGYEYIKLNAFDNLTTVDWKERYPELNDRVTNSLKVLSTIFHEINEKPFDLMVDNPQDIYRARYPTLPITAFAYIEQHINLHRMIQMLTQMNSMELNQDFFLLAKKVLGINYDALPNAAYDNNSDLLEFSILRHCITSPLFNKAVLYMPCIRENSLIKKLGLISPFSEDDLLVKFLQKKELSLPVLTKLLTYPQSKESSKIIFEHDLISSLVLDDDQFSSLLINLSVLDLDLVFKALDRMPFDDDAKKIQMKALTLNTFKVTEGDVATQFITDLLGLKVWPDELILQLTTLEFTDSLWRFLLEHPLITDTTVETLAKALDVKHLPILLNIYASKLSIESRTVLASRTTNDESLNKLIDITDHYNRFLFEEILKNRASNDDIRKKLLSKINTIQQFEEYLTFGPKLDESAIVKAVIAAPLISTEEKNTFLLKCDFSTLDTLFIKNIVNFSNFSHPILLHVLNETDRETAISVFSEDFLTEDILNGLLNGLLVKVEDEDIVSPFLSLLLSVAPRFESLVIDKLTALVPTQPLAGQIRDNLINQVSQQSNFIKLTAWLPAENVESYLILLNQSKLTDEDKEALKNELENAQNGSIDTQPFLIPALFEDPIDELQDQIIENNYDSDVFESDDDFIENPLYAPDPIVDEEIKNAVNTFISHINTIKNKELERLVLCLTDYSNLYLKNELTLNDYKSVCKSVLKLFEPELNKASQRSLTIFEHITEGLRMLFNMIDHLVSIFSSSTMANTYTPGAQTLVGRNHFFIKPNRETDLNQVVQSFKTILSP